MGADDRPSRTGDAPRSFEESVLERYLLAAVEPDRDDFDRWAAGQPELVADKVLRVAVAARLDEWLRVLRLLGGDLGRSPGREPSGDGSSAGPTLAPGARIARFTLRAFVARGGMGQVWVADDDDLGARVALKLVLPSRLDEHALARVTREAKAGGRLNHPGIVATLDHGVDGGIAWIAQELVDGARTLKDLIDERSHAPRLPADHFRQVTELVARIADALQAAHDAGVVHRDVKPANVLLTAGGAPKVTDFGLARVVGDSFVSRVGDLAGTWAYMSPEQVTAKRMGLDHRTDVFSLGVVLYELLTLRRPFEGDTTAQIAEQIIAWDPPHPTRLRSHCPAALATICSKALEKAPGRRYATMAEFAADLRRHLASAPIVARPPGPLARSLRWARRHPTAAGVMTVAVLGLTVVGALLAANLRINRDLALQTRAAEAAAAQERERLAEVLQLSALQDVQALVAEADTLWPATPARIDDYVAWLRRARALVDGRAKHVEVLERLRAEAAPQSDAERLALRERHPDHARWRELGGQVAFRRRALEQRRDGVATPVPEVEWASGAGDATALVDRAWELVGPGRAQFGEEPQGLALALRGVQQSQGPDDDLASALDTLAWAYHALGRDAEALEASARALAAAPPKQQETFAGFQQDLAAAVSEASSPAGIARAADELAALEAELSELAARVERRWLWTFPEHAAKTGWWHAQLTELIERLDALDAALVQAEATTPEHGWSVPRRLEFARRMERDFAPGGAEARAWAQALPALRAAYPAVALEPIVGLRPLGPDPDSRLWEFAHLATGEPPRRGDDGRLVLDEGSGVVLVLLPGGEFSMGAQKGDAGLPRFDPDAEGNEGPVHRVTLSPFFMGKHELTQAQWRRATGANPSDYQKPPEVMSALHPVERVSWLDCDAALRRLGLALPSEAQWEYAARAGTETIWWTGPERESLRGIVNIADRTALEAGAPWRSIQAWPDNEDGGVVHREIGAYPPNRFGLHEMAGNVYEWCRDVYVGTAYTRGAVRDPVVEGGPADDRVTRGGSFVNSAAFARSASRDENPPEFREFFLGARAALELARD